MTTCACGTIYKPDSYWLRYGVRVATCPKCGLTVEAPRERQEIRSASVIDDTLPGGARWMENLGHKPEWIETKTQLKRALDDRGLALRDSGPHNTNDRSPWATMTRLR